MSSTCPPDETLAITVTEDGSSPIGFELSERDAGSVGPEDVHDAYDALLKAGVDTATADALRTAAELCYESGWEADDAPEATGSAPDGSTASSGSGQVSEAFPFSPTADSIQLEGYDEQAFVESAAEALSVPSDVPGITYTLSDTYYWDGGATYLCDVVFQGPGGYVAGASGLLDGSGFKSILIRGQH